MKILFVAANFKPFKYPNGFDGGGTELVEYQQLNALLSLGHEVTIAASSDSEVTGLDFISLPVLSQSAAGKYYLSKVIDAIDEVQHKFDRILANKAWTMNLKGDRALRCKEWAHKLRIVSHEPPVYVKGMPGFENKLATMKWMVGLGARVASPMADGGAQWQQMEDDLRAGKNFKKRNAEIVELLDSVPHSILTDFFEANVVGDDAVDVDDFTEGNSIIYVSRPSLYKGFKIATDACQKAGLIDRFQGFTCSPCGKNETETWDKSVKYHDHFRVDVPHAEIMRSLASASMFLQPTSSEASGGLVSFEAAIHGLPVVTTTDTGQRYLKPFGLYYFAERKAKAVAETIQAVSPLTLMRRKEVARKVRAEYSKEAYAKRVEDFLV